MWCFNNYNDRGYTLGQLVSMGYQVFTPTWECYVKEHTPELQQKIIKHYYFYEIGQDEPDKFRHYLNETLERIMPYYNQMYRSELIKFDPIMNHFMETNGRSIENALRNVTSSDSEVTKALENYAKSSKGITNTKDGVAQGVTESETYGRVYSEDKDTTENETTTEDKTRTEDITKEFTGKTTLGETKSTTSDTVTKHSDTPQTLVSGDVNESYLTDYNHQTVSGTEKHDATTDVTSKEVTDDLETEDNTTKRTLTGTVDTDGKIDDTRNKTTTTDRNQTISSTADSFDNSSTDNNSSRALSHDEQRSNLVSNDNNQTMSGYMNMSPSQLLQAFRETFLNVDEMIIRDVGENFMEVF